MLVGLDREAALREIGSRAPIDESAQLAAERAARLHLEGTGAAEKISTALKTRPTIGKGRA